MQLVSEKMPCYPEINLIQWWLWKIANNFVRWLSLPAIREHFALQFQVTSDPARFDRNEQNLLRLIISNRELFMYENWIILARFIHFIYSLERDLFIKINLVPNKIYRRHGFIRQITVKIVPISLIAWSKLNKQLLAPFNTRPLHLHCFLLAVLHSSIQECKEFTRKFEITVAYWKLELLNTL